MSTPTILAKSRRVLRFAPPVDETAYFYAADDDTGASTTGLLMTAQDWHDMGEPTEVTVTIEPGDHLNP